MILLRGPAGERRVRENEQFRLLPGEEVIGIAPENLSDVITNDGVMLGNAVKKVTTVLGLKHCMKCSHRQRMLNEKGLGIQQRIKGWWRRD